MLPINVLNGFRTKHSTDLAFTEFIDSILFNVDDKRITSTVFVGLSKAFGTLDHKILIDKLQHYGIRGISLMWFESCLSKEQSQSTLKVLTSNHPHRLLLLECHKVQFWDLSCF